jgi:hypothetical protein
MRSLSCILKINVLDGHGEVSIVKKNRDREQDLVGYRYRQYMYLNVH